MQYILQRLDKNDTVWSDTHEPSSTRHIKRRRESVPGVVRDGNVTSTELASPSQHPQIVILQRPSPRCTWSDVLMIPIDHSHVEHPHWSALCLQEAHLLEKGGTSVAAPIHRVSAIRGMPRTWRRRAPRSVPDNLDRHLHGTVVRSLRTQQFGPSHTWRRRALNARWRGDNLDCHIHGVVLHPKRTRRVGNERSVPLCLRFLPTRHGVPRTHRTRGRRTPALGTRPQCAMLHRRSPARRPAPVSYTVCHVQFGFPRRRLTHLCRKPRVPAGGCTYAFEAALQTDQTVYSIRQASSTSQTRQSRHLPFVRRCTATFLAKDDTALPIGTVSLV